MKEAIKKAIEGGYQPPLEDIPNGINQAWINHFCVLNPNFWKALGKHQGWEEDVDKFDDKHLVGKQYLSYWHLFIDHIAQEKNIDDFFNNLLV